MICHFKCIQRVMRAVVLLNYIILITLQEKVGLNLHEEESDCSYFEVNFEDGDDDGDEATGLFICLFDKK